MKKINWILLLLLFTSCKSSKIISEEELFGFKTEVGKCYFSIKKDFEAPDNNDFYSTGFVLEISKIEYQTIKKKATPEEVKNFPQDNSPFRLETWEPHFKYVLKNKPVLDFLNDRDQNGLVVCGAEIPGHYRTMTIEELKQNNYIYDYNIVIPQQIFQIKVKDKPKFLKDNQFYFTKGYWTKFREVIYPSHSPNRNKLVKEIQTKLKELGYDVEVNNILDTKTKKALLEFQKKHNILVNQLDYDTLKALGIEN